MIEDKRLIDANALLDRLIRIERGCLDIDSDFAKGTDWSHQQGLLSTSGVQMHKEQQATQHLKH